MDIGQLPREKRLALLISAGIGAFIGIVVSYVLTSPHLGECYGWKHGMDWACLASHYWFRMFFWPIAGVATGGAVVYVQILLRR